MSGATAGRKGQGPWPSADAVAALIVQACAETGEDPLSAANPEALGVMARAYALHGLNHAWDRSVAELSRLVGYATARSPAQLEGIRLGTKWDWDVASDMEDAADELRAADNARRAASDAA